MKIPRYIASWILMVAYLPLVVVSSLHVHHDTIDITDNCNQCAGHFETPHHHESDCQYCHFLSLSYLGHDQERSTINLPSADNCHPEKTTMKDSILPGISMLRAPPFHSVYSLKA